MTRVTPTIVVLVLSLVVVVAGALVIRFAVPVAKFFYSAGSPTFGSKLSSRSYTPRNMKIAGVGFIAFGVILLVVAALGFGGVIQPEFAQGL